VTDKAEEDEMMIDKGQVAEARLLAYACFIIAYCHASSATTPITQD